MTRKCRTRSNSPECEEEATVYAVPRTEGARNRLRVESGGDPFFYARCPKHAGRGKTLTHWGWLPLPGKAIDIRKIILADNKKEEGGEKDE